MTVSDEIRYAIDKEVDRILKESYHRVKQLLKMNEKKMISLA
jgi:ATP-dependent Zn protease